MNVLPEAVNTLVKKAASAEKSEDAMRYSQAALNAANAAIALSNVKPKT